MKLIFLLTLLIHTSRSGTTVSSTNNGEECMTNCIPYSDYHFCYKGWGSSNWDYCKVKMSDRHVQYFTSMVVGDKPLCTSSCGLFGESYQWCFTGEGGLWDKCATNSKECNDCSKTSSGYQCKKADGYLVYCAPDPIYYDEFDSAKDALQYEVGRYIDQSFVKCRPNRYGRFSEETLRDYGVQNLARSFKLLYNYTAMTSGAITSITTVTATPINDEIVNTILPLVIRATLRRQNLNNVREQIPYFIEHQMQLMHRNPNDERGHLLASSLGGPMHTYNFAPQTPIVNRNDGGESYWYHIEGNLRDTLRNDTVDHIDWTLIVIYEDVMLIRRPIGFGLQYIVYDGQNNVLRDTGDMYFSNHPQGGCII